MARLATPPALDIWALWSRALWRATAPCVAVMLLLCAWSMFGAQPGPAVADLSLAFDNTVLGVLDQEQAPDPGW